MTATRMASQKTPVVIIGSGIAGLLTALKLAEWKIDCVVVSKTKLTENSSRMAQGGIAAVLPTNPDDSLLLHLKDTLDAGAGLSNRVIAKSILNDGADAITDLLELGVPFDTDTQSGSIALGLEGAHSTRRILHAGGDSTGATVQETLTQRVLENPHITVLEQCFVKNLLTDPTTKQCMGVVGVQRTSKGTGSSFSPYLKWLAIEAEHIVLATGGVGRLYSHTTNPAVSTGDGVALAYRAGADIQDVEFIQFHPTAFWGPKGAEFLISEALRGEGGILRDVNGEAFAKSYHPLGELAPRDIVARMIVDTIQKQNTPHVYLDMTHLDPTMLETRFPSIIKLCERFDVDLRKDWIPVAPAAHYWMGALK